MSNCQTRLLSSGLYLPVEGGLCCVLSRTASLLGSVTSQGTSAADIGEDTEAPDDDAAEDSEPEEANTLGSEDEDLDSDEERRYACLFVQQISAKIRC